MAEEYEKIVIAVDGSTIADKAFEKAVEVAKRNDATLILSYVVDTRAIGSAEIYDKHLIDKVESYAKEMLEEYKDKARKAGLHHIESVIKLGSPKVAITREIAPEHHADLIIIGATGLNAVERFMIGSVSESVIRHAKCDVLLVR